MIMMRTQKLAVFMYQYPSLKTVNSPKQHAKIWDFHVTFDISLFYSHSCQFIIKSIINKTLLSSSMKWYMRWYNQLGSWPFRLGQSLYTDKRNTGIFMERRDSFGSPWSSPSSPTLYLLQPLVQILLFLPLLYHFLFREVLFTPLLKFKLFRY